MTRAGAKPRTIPADAMVVYVLPLRPDLEITLRLPQQPTPAEIAHISGWLQNLAAGRGATHTNGKGNES
jgi:hypothetical protein